MKMVNGLPNGVVAMKRHSLVGLMLAAATLLVSACDKAQLLAPTNSSLSISAAALTIPSGGSTNVQAMVLEQAGTPVQNGTTVRFTTTLGRLDPVEAQTRNGVATTTLFGDGASGVAEVRAVSGSASGGTGDTLSNRVQIAVGSGAVGEGGVTVRANPATVPVAGGTVDVIATVVGENNAALSGVLVSFSTNRGTLSATSAMTNAAGEARVQLTTNREATVTAAVGSRAGTVTVGILTPATVALTASAAIVGQPMTLTVTPATGTAPRVVVNWGDGSETDLGIVSAERRVTHVYGESGSYAITATATDGGDSFTNSVGVTVSPRPSPTVTVTPTTGTTAQNFVFTITPPTGGAGIRDVSVDFGDGSEVSLGAITSATPVSHQFSSAGTYTVRVTLTDGGGAETFGIVVVTVN
jgi:PKD repeat protein